MLIFKNFSRTAAVFAILFLLSLSVCAKSESVAVTITDFPVNINHEQYTCDEYNMWLNMEYRTIPNSQDVKNYMLYNEYPIVTHNNIAYYPLTYYNCNLLGLSLELRGNTVSVSKLSTDNPLVYQRDNLRQTRRESSFYMTGSPFEVVLQGSAYRDENYPALFYNNIVYLPLTWNVVKDIFGWEYSFDENGEMNLFSENFTYYSTGASSIEMTNEYFSAGVNYGRTYYRKGDLEVYSYLQMQRIGGPFSENLVITKGAEKIVIPGFTGFSGKAGPIFSLDGKYIYTYHCDRTRNSPCMIDIQTGEIIYSN